MNSIKCKLTLILVFYSYFLLGQEYFVEPSGGTFLSTDISAPGEIAFAFLNAPPKAIVWIKAGYYGPVNLVVGNDSTSFIGYKLEPGDILSPTLNDYDVDDPSNPLGFNSNEMPLLDQQNRLNGKAIKVLPKRHVTIKNFQIQNYKYAIEGHHDGHYENINCQFFGDESDNYHGHGIYLPSPSNRNVIKNCVVADAGAENYRGFGSKNLFVNCKSFSGVGGGIDGTDYHFLIAKDSSIIQNCHSERKSGGGPGGHGFTINGKNGNRSRYNLIENCTGISNKQVILLRDSAWYNTIKDFSAYSCWRGIQIDDGASYNKISGGYIDTTRSVIPAAIFYWDTAVANDTAVGNIFENIVAHDVNYFAYSVGQPTKNELYLNCTIDSIRNALYSFPSGTDDIVFTNCNISNSSAPLLGNLNTNNIDFKFCNFWNNNFANPTGEELLEVGPKYIDRVNFNFNLELDSPLRDMGSPSQFSEVDFQGLERPIGLTSEIGAYELECQPINLEIVSNNNTLSSNQPNAIYQWINCDTNEPIPNENMINFTAQVNGNYAAIITYYGCKDTSECVTVNTVVTNFIDEPKFKIFPNPNFNGFLYIHSGSINAKEIKIFTINGVLIHTEMVNNPNHSVSVNELPEGIYILEIISDANYSVRRMFVKV